MFGHSEFLHINSSDNFFRLCFTVAMQCTEPEDMVWCAALETRGLRAIKLFATISPRGYIYIIYVNLLALKTGSGVIRFDDLVSPCNLETFQRVCVVDAVLQGGSKTIWSVKGSTLRPTKAL